MSATVTGGGNVCCQPNGLPPVARSTGARNWAPPRGGRGTRHPRRDYATRRFQLRSSVTPKSGEKKEKERRRRRRETLPETRYKYRIKGKDRTEKQSTYAKLVCMTRVPPPPRSVNLPTCRPLRKKERSYLKPESIRKRNR